MKQKEMNDTAIIMLNYNQCENCIKSVNTLLKNYLIPKIVLVDNCSTDNSFEILANEYTNVSHVYLIKTSMNNGYSFGNNNGIDFIRCFLPKVKYIFICNPDVLIEESNIFVDACNMLNNRNVGAVTVNSSYKTFGENYLPSGWYFETKKSLCFQFSKVKIKNKSLISINLIKRYIKKTGNNFYKVDCCQGCFFGIKLETLISIKCFDENVFLYYEEEMLGKKIKKKHLQSYVLLNHQLLHNHSLNNKNSRFLRKEFLKSRMYYIRKYYSHHLLIIFFSNIIIKKALKAM